MLTHLKKVYQIAVVIPRGSILTCEIVAAGALDQLNYVCCFANNDYKFACIFESATGVHKRHLCASCGLKLEQCMSMVSAEFPGLSAATHYQIIKRRYLMILHNMYIGWMRLKPPICSCDLCEEGHVEGYKNSSGSFEICLQCDNKMRKIKQDVLTRSWGEELYKEFIVGQFTWLPNELWQLIAQFVVSLTAQKMLDPVYTIMSPEATADLVADDGLRA